MLKFLCKIFHHKNNLTLNWRWTYGQLALCGDKKIIYCNKGITIQRVWIGPSTRKCRFCGLIQNVNHTNPEDWK